MKFIFIITILFLYVACDGKDQKNTETRSVATKTTPVEEEIIIEEEVPVTSTEIEPEPIPESLPPVLIITDPEPELETDPQSQPESELENQPDSEPKLEPEHETQIEVSPKIEPEIPMPTIIETLYDFEILKNKGIHIVGRSILHEIRNPSAIYCSNTTFLNHEKIEELRVLFNALKGEEISVMDGTKMPVLLLKSLIERAVILLESNPDSRFCPLIYLAIDDI